MPETITDTIDQANRTLQTLLNGLQQAQDAEAKARADRDAAAKTVQDLTAALAQARADEQRAIARHGQAGENRRQWSLKVDQVKNQIDKINMELAALAKLSQQS